MDLCYFVTANSIQLQQALPLQALLQTAAGSGICLGCSMQLTVRPAFVFATDVHMGGWPSQPDDNRSRVAGSLALLCVCMQLPQDTTEDNWRNIFATNVDGVFHTVRAAYPLLKRSKHGKVVITSSIGGETGRQTRMLICHRQLSCARGVGLHF
jgi:hypothetical protein